MKKLWQNKRKAEGKPFDKPNIIMNSAVQVCWEKAARYFEVEERFVYCTVGFLDANKKRRLTISRLTASSLTPRSAWT
jgi:glutamate/tyrosine decarboxylase-like PLP-dependent enzyme